jgi:hypothetical protein
MPLDSNGLAGRAPLKTVEIADTAELTEILASRAAVEIIKRATGQNVPVG